MNTLEERKRKLEEELSAVNTALRNKSNTQKVLDELTEKLDLIKKLIPNFNYTTEISDYHGKIILKETSLTSDHERTTVVENNDEILKMTDYVLKNVDTVLNTVDTIKSQLEEDDSFNFYPISQEFAINNRSIIRDGLVFKSETEISLIGSVNKDKLDFSFECENSKREYIEKNDYVNFEGVQFYRYYEVNECNSFDLEDRYSCDVENLDIHDLKEKRQSLTEFIMRDSRVINFK